MSNHEDIIATATQNVISLSVIAATFRWSAFIPPPERMIEWILGALVAVSILTYNIIRIVQAIKYRGRNRKSDD